MPVYQCPVCGRRGIYSIGSDDFYEWLAEYFGPYYVADPDTVLPMPCQEHYDQAGNPATNKDFQEWLENGNNHAAASNGRAAKTKARVRAKKKTVPDDDGKKSSKRRLAAIKQEGEISKETDVVADWIRVECDNDKFTVYRSNKAIFSGTKAEIDDFLDLLEGKNYSSKRTLIGAITAASIFALATGTLLGFLLCLL